MFDIGQPVVCIDASNIDELVEGKTYIEWEGMFQPPGGEDLLCVQVEGVRRKMDPGARALCEIIIGAGRRLGMEDDLDLLTLENTLNVWDGAPFRATRFAPIENKKKTTDISELEKLLATRVLEDA